MRMSIILPTNLVILERWQSQMETMVEAEAAVAAKASDYIDDDYNSAGPVVVFVVSFLIHCRRRRREHHDDYIILLLLFAVFARIMMMMGGRWVVVVCVRLVVGKKRTRERGFSQSSFLVGWSRGDRDTSHLTDSYSTVYTRHWHGVERNLRDPFLGGECHFFLFRTEK